ncbi:MAG: SLC13 family permease [Acidaminococcaceae bacterium]|nr:SLC13 family permease [Acidaminococcaceae bacterium]
MALLSLGLLGAAIIIAFLKKMNAGLLCIAFAMVLGHAAGIPDKDIIKGFSYNLFLTLLGVTYLFSLAQSNGTLKIIAVKTISLAGRRTYLVPVYIFIFSTVLSAIGPGCIPTMAIMMVFAMTLASELKIHPAMLSAIVVLGASGGGVSPIAPTGIIAQNLCMAAGITEPTGRQFLINGVLSCALYSLVVYFAFGGYKIKSAESSALAGEESLDNKQKITLLGILCMVIMVMFFKYHVGLTSFFIAGILSFFRVADENYAWRYIPWGTLILVGGVSVLINLIVKLGGIAMLSQAMASIMSPATAPSIMGLSAGILSWVSSTSGVVMPTFIPTIPGVVAAMGGNVDPVELATSLSMMSHTAGISPMSTGGGLALAAYTAVARSTTEEQQKLFLTIFLVSAAGLLFLSGMAYVGLFRWFI